MPSLYPDQSLLFDQAPVGYLTTDLRGRIMLVNHTLLEWSGYTDAELQGAVWSQVLLGPAGRVFLESHAQPLLDERHVVRDLLLDLRCKDQQRLPVLLSARLDMAAAPGNPDTSEEVLRYSFVKAVDRIHYEHQLLSAKQLAEDASEQLRELASDLEKMVAQRTAELTAAYQDLDSFAQTVSHDLRAPLRVVSGYCDLLSIDAGPKLDKVSVGHLQQIRQAVLTMNAMIDGLLQLSLGARAELEYQQVDISALATRICTEMKLSAEQGSAAHWQVQPGLLVQGDARLLEIVLRNLIGNAWKYSSRAAEPMLKVSAECSHDECIVSVVDNGVGFDMHTAQQLFQPFKRLPSGRTFPGIGIGLSTVKRIVERHGGRVFARSDPGQGAAFCFALPVSEAPSGH